MEKGTELYIACAREKGWGNTQYKEQQGRMGNVHKIGTTRKDG
jgi:hypothetical protein